MLPFSYFPWNSHHIPRIITAPPRSHLDNGSPRPELLFSPQEPPSTAAKLRGKSALRMYRRMLPMSKAAIGKPAPDFTAKAVFDMDFIDVKLSDYKGKYVVLFFYPADFTFVCPTEIIAFSDRFDEFEALGVQVLACSTDSHFTHLAWISQPRKQGGLGDMKIPVLSDKTMQISRDYGVLKEDEGMSFRGLFIIDTNGILRQITINDMPVGRSVDETLRLVQAFQFVDKHGEVCPAGWKPGENTIKPEVKQSKEYFEKANANGH